MSELPRTYVIQSVQREAAGTASVWLTGSFAVAPGQFVMVWVPRLGEKPYAVSYVQPERFAITVKERGPLSTHLAKLKPGDRIGIRGPYGRGFTLNPKCVLVAGAVGAATLAPLKDQFPQAPFLFGARSAGEVLYAARFPDMRIFTDDGTAGTKGYPTDVLAALLYAGGVEVVYTCGPEVMMVRVLALCEQHGVNCQASLERYMKCGFGVCGMCACGAVLICKDGPVFDSAALRRMPQFGKTALLKDGTQVPVATYLASRSLPERDSRERVP